MQIYTSLMAGLRYVSVTVCSNKVVLLGEKEGGQLQVGRVLLPPVFLVTLRSIITEN